MRHRLPALAVLAASALLAVPAMAVREQGPLKASPSSSAATLFLLFLTAIIIGVSMMNPRRTHQD